MSFSVGIVGLPNVGKSTLFKALTKRKVNIAPYPFTTISPNYGLVTVPDQRLEEIAKIIKPEKVTPTIIEFVDIAGLVKGSHRGEGLGNQFLAQIRNCSAILAVIRAFQDPKVENILGEIDPKKEIEILRTELLMKDLETLEKAIGKVEKGAKRDKKFLRKLRLLKKIKEELARGKSIFEIDLMAGEKEEIREYQFLTQKPVIHLLNIGQGKIFNQKEENFLSLNLKLEEEISELSPEELKELGLKSQINQLISRCYQALSLITFFTVAGGKEVRAWTVEKGTPCQKAGGLIHSDFEEKFIRAEIVHWQDLIKAGSFSKARELGYLKTVGKEYLVEDGDIIEFKI